MPVNAAKRQGVQRMPGAGPGITTDFATALAAGLAAPLGLPDARAGAVGVAAPGPGAARARKPTLAGCGLVAGADGHDHGAVLGHLAADVDRRRPRVAEVAVRDADRIAIGRIALAGLGHDHDAPEPVVARPGFGSLEPGKRGHGGERRQPQ